MTFIGGGMEDFYVWRNVGVLCVGIEDFYAWRNGGLL